MKRPRQLGPDELFSYAVKKLGGRAASVGEIRRALTARAADAACVEGILDRLREYGYLDDQRFAESFTAARLENDGFGRSRVVRDLRQRRVEFEVAEQAVTKIYAGQEETELIEQFIRRKYKRTEEGELFATQQELASAYRKLVRAGFNGSSALSVLKRFAAHPEMLEE